MGFIPGATIQQDSIRDVWPVYSGPTRNVASRDVIGKSRVSADNAGELALRRTIRFINLTATGASARSVARVHRHHLDADLLRLVTDKTAQLEERPAMPLRPLRLANRYPFTNAAQIFQGDAAVGVFGLLHNAFADVVVHPSRKAPFLTRKFFRRRRLDFVPLLCNLDRKRRWRKRTLLTALAL